MVDRVPSPVRTLISFTQSIVSFLGRIIEDEATFAALRAELGLPPAPHNEDSVADVQAKLGEVSGRLTAAEAQSDKDLALDDQIMDLLDKGKLFTEIATVLVQDRYASDARSVADFAYEMVGVLATEQMRVQSPLAWAILRVIMLGYEKVEEVPRFDPLAIFDRLTGNRTSTAATSSGAVEAIGGFGIPAFAIGTNLLVNKFVEKSEVELAALEEGTPYFSGAVDFKLGWEPDPDTPAELQSLFARSAIIRVRGGIKRKSTNDESVFILDLGFVYFDDPAEGPGIHLRLSAGFENTLDFAPRNDVKFTLKTSASGAGFLDLWWILGKELRYIGAADSTVTIGSQFTAAGTELSPAIRAGHPEHTRLEVVEYGLGFEASRLEQFVILPFRGVKVVLDLAELLPGLKDLFSAVGLEKFEAKFDGALKWSPPGNVVFEGEAGLTTRLLSHKNFGTVKVDYVDVGLAVRNQALRLTVQAAGRFSIGPFAASMGDFGIDIALAGASGIDFIPPTSIGVRVAGKVISGGGFLMLDAEARQFAGAFELAVDLAKLRFSVNAIAILSTGGPDNPVKFSLFILVFARFPGGLEMGLRFTLNAVGGILGINHDFDESALMKALPSGAMDDVLFPANPVADAPRIISSLKTVFPARPNTQVIGLMAEASWGSDYFCTLRLGLILPVGDSAGPAEGFSYLYILGRLSVVCFEDLPKAIRLQLICDFVGHIGIGDSGVDIGLFARLRDSRFGPTKIEGAIAISIRTGPESRFLIAAGGFHPSFKEIPDDLPPIDRIGATYDIGVIKTWIRGYFAIASGSLQFGVDAGVRYKLGPISFEASIGFDALIHLSPFSFEAGVRASAALKYRGRELFGVHLSLTVWGPDRWRIKGHGSFSILFWDVSVDVDESWGDDVAIEQTRLNLAELVGKDLANDSYWSYQLPAGGTLVSLNVVPPAEGAAHPVHPLSSMSYVQRRIPFGLNLERVGFCGIEGLTNFPVPTIAVTSASTLADATVVTDQFPVPEYLDLTDAQKLSRPGFETLPAGVATGAGGYIVPNGIDDTPFDCELIFSRRTGGGILSGLLELGAGAINVFTAREAASRSQMRPLQPSRPDLDPVGVLTPQWVVADHDRMVQVDTGVFAAGSGSAFALEHEFGGVYNVVEMYELGG
ncbi:DUF6603 domain-containing protein [Cryobacterium arcticum]|uniref:DUF6603 domain-containing protein n=1 Tax=Cryobacterium arcticum TaxID=670052 RepID=A0A317ZKK1_9MICO|nr:DUF6603 domain-containing protein [Cryobacterium arcticum]PXA67080.1 hypothetical protein CTB96_09910 [Cryobacterium arcticum]